MNWTNVANLPAPLVSAIKNDTYDKVGRISITGLIEPPRMHQLKGRHDSEITEDAADGIWRLIGSIGHKIVERADNDNHLSEERITMDVLGWTVSGKADLLNPDMLLSDYKFTSVYAVLHEKPDWGAQLNMYAALYRANGFEVKAAQIVAVLRDWSKLRAKREPGYPQVGVKVQPIELWSEEKQYEFLCERVGLHQQAEWLLDDELPLCTDEERWKKDDVWAVKKKGNKRALPGGLHSTSESASAFARVKDPTLKTVEIEFRGGSYPRCESYCAVKEFCQFGRSLSSHASTEDEETA